MRTNMYASATAAVLCGLLTTAIPLANAGKPGPEEPQFTTDFNLENCRKLVPKGGNPYFSLEPGTFLRYEGEDDGEFVELEITVLNQTQSFQLNAGGITIPVIARVIEEREWADGELIEVSRNYYSRCPDTGNIFYFGEEVDVYKDGEIVSNDGA